MKNIIIFIIILSSFGLKAQNIINSRFHILNHSILNPAYIGTYQFTSISLFSSHKWFNVKNYPYTQGLIVSGNNNENSWGILLLNNRWGNFYNLSIQLTYSYKAKINDEWNIFSGLNANVNQFTLNQTNYKPAEENDAALSYHKEKAIIPNFNAGILLSNNFNFIGISIYNLLQNNYKITTNDEEQNKLQRHFIISGAYNFTINEKLNIKPMMYLIKNTYSKLYLDISSITTYDNKYFAGIGFNTNKEISFMGGLFYKEFQFSYSYGFNLYLSSYINSSLHEISCSYRFKKEGKKLL